MLNVNFPYIIGHRTPHFSHTFTVNFAVFAPPAATKMAPETVKRSTLYSWLTVFSLFQSKFPCVLIHLYKPQNDSVIYTVSNQPHK